ncbi:MAG: hypothetical protein FD127_1894 [Acidimicrobiaceae bacterium]|jgi:hypothetical protein|nr:MAG: hypothetical protein FD127_1894 [Acidimicrobiaceae bacterium]
MLRKAAAIFAVSSVAVGCGSRDAADAPNSTTAARSSTGLECGGERERLLEYDLDPERQGTATQEETADEALAFYIDHDGGEVAMLRSDAYALEVGGRTVVVADVTQATAGGFWVTTIHVCDSFVPVETGPPETAPPVSGGP